MTSEMSHIPTDYELVIRPSRGWISLDLFEVWRYRDLLIMLVHRDFVSKYKQTILGPAWFVLQPLLMTLIFTVIFGNVAKIPTDGAPAILFYLAGLVGWGYFAQTFQATSGSLVNNAGLLGKVYFPRLVVPLSAVISNMLALALQFATFLVAWCYFKFLTEAGGTLEISASAFLFPLLVLQIAALSLGVGVWLAALTVKYRDFTFLTVFIVQIWMYATPVIYPLSQIPERWRWLAVLNPMTMPVESIKFMFLGRGTVTGPFVALSVALALLLLVSGLLVFNKIEKTFVDTV
jgi:lipopolysaccharide transport system permease protein